MFLTFNYRDEAAKILLHPPPFLFVKLRINGPLFVFGKMMFFAVKVRLYYCFRGIQDPPKSPGYCLHLATRRAVVLDGVIDPERLLRMVS